MQRLTAALRHTQSRPGRGRDGRDWPRTAATSTGRSPWSICPHHTLSATARAFGQPRDSGDVPAELIEEAARVDGIARPEAAAMLGRLAGLLDRAGTDDTDLLTRRLRAAAPGNDVVLTPAGRSPTWPPRPG